MRSRRAFASFVVAAAALAGVGTGSAAAQSDDDRDKNALLAEAQFLLFLLTTTDFEPSDVTCTTPPARDDAGDLVCYALISRRVTVAALAEMQSPGVYTFIPLHKVDPADLGLLTDAEATPAPPAPETPTPDTPDSPESQDTPESPTAPEDGDQPAAPEPQSAADQAVLDSVNQTLAEADILSDVLLDNNEQIVTVDRIDYHGPTWTLQIDITTDGAAQGVRDAVAFSVTNIAALLWEEGQPFRDEAATIQPRLEVTIDETIYGTPFDVMTQVADFTITQTDWLDIVTGTAAMASNDLVIDKGSPRLS